jgi:hypothetical protein
MDVGAWAKRPVDFAVPLASIPFSSIYRRAVRFFPGRHRWRGKAGNYFFHVKHIHCLFAHPSS